MRFLRDLFESIREAFRPNPRARLGRPEPALARRHAGTLGGGMTRTDDLITRDDPASVRTRRECRLWLCPRKNPRPGRVARRNEKGPAGRVQHAAGPHK